MSEFARHTQFVTTRWSIVLRAGTGGEEARRAVGDLCEVYWQPLYFFLRRRGHHPEEAMDLTQGFLADLLARGLGPLDREKGRFRSYLMGALENYLGRERERASAQKRGGDTAHISLDGPGAEAAYQQADTRTPDPAAAYQRQWALSLLHRVVGELEASYREGGQGDLFEALKGTITGELDEPYARLGERLGMSETAVKVAAHRLRQRYRVLFRQTVLSTLADESEFEDEVAFLIKAIGG